MAILEQKTGGFRSIAQIGEDVLRAMQTPEEKVKAHCRSCGKEELVYQCETWDPINPIICKDCKEKRDAEYREKKAAEYRKSEIVRLGGIKAYDRFTLFNYTNKAAIDKCAGFPEANLFLWGATGTGKTHLATALIRSFPDGTVFKPQDIFRRCRGQKSGDDEQDIINRFINTEHMVIDDLGVDKKTDFSFSILYEILEGRDMNYINGLIITSNLSLSALAERLCDDRITSRIAGMCRIVEITGADGRLKPR